MRALDFGSPCADDGDSAAPSEKDFESDAGQAWDLEEVSERACCIRGMQWRETHLTPMRTGRRAAGCRVR